MATRLAVQPPTSGLVTYDRASVAPDRYEASRGHWWRHGRVTAVTRYTRGWVASVTLRGWTVAHVEIILHARSTWGGAPCPVTPRVGDGVSLRVERRALGTTGASDLAVTQVTVGEVVALDWHAAVATGGVASGGVATDATGATARAIRRWRDLASAS